MSASLLTGLMEVASHAPHALLSPPGGDNLNSLDAEISELQRENARVESQMLRLRTDISAMEAHLRHDKVQDVKRVGGSPLLPLF